MSITPIRRFLAIPTLLAVCTAFLFSGCGAKSDETKKSQPTLPVMAVNAGDATVSTQYSAMLEGKVNVEVRPQVDGTLRSINVEEGAFVKAGQALFKIDDTPYREQYNSALALQHAAEATLVAAKLNEEKLVPLVQNNVVSDIQLKTAQANTQAAIAAVEQSRASARAAKVNLDYTTVKAPVSGYIGKIPFRVGSLVSKNQSAWLTMLSDVSEISANFSMSEIDFMKFREHYAGGSIEEKVKRVAPVSLIMADGSLYPEKGSIGTISGQFDQGTGSVRIRAAFPNPKATLRAGSSGKVVIESLYHNELLVPQAATVELQDKIFVFVLGKGNSVRKQVIAVAGKSGSSYIVSEGIKAGEVIVTAGIEKLQEGTVIKPVRPVSVVAAVPAKAAPASKREIKK
ncbi:MAG: efflux RND transporter periplasmic adaptor subunit [Chlorobiaceae bacterium]